MDYRSIIESKYNRNSWQALLHDIFKTGANFRTTPIVVDCNSPLAVTSLQLGIITLADDNKIAVYEIKLADNVDIIANRVGIRNLLISNWKMQGCVGAFMFCYRDNESVLRFSYVSSTFKFNDAGKMEKDETDTKRYTYILGAGHRSRTAIKQFEDLKNSKLMLADLTKAFSIEALSDRFFKEYKENYENIIEYITGKRMVKVENKWKEKIMHAPNTAIMEEFSWSDDSEKAVRDYVKKLMGRIVFLQFIQKKGWLGVPAGKEWGEGDKEYLQNLYDHCQNKDNFIDGNLEILFDDINNKRVNDIANPILGNNIKVPYLNGGLFEQDKADKCIFRLPQRYLDNLFKFFSSYNFTIDENDPDDAEIGVDPEMLGRIFENLLEDNKDKGAFYTPKEIVQYMCRESLIAYLQTGKNEEDKQTVRTFVTTYNPDIIDDELKSDIGQKLIDIKICDPAIGSGAFPMGLLKELFACRSAIEGLDNDKAADIKKHIIQNNIYGVDIEKGAVDIARLRFWLALIVDERTPHALPNMDFKIMQGNSLIPTFNGKYVNLSDKLRHVNSSKIRDAKKELYSLQSKYYESEGDDKNELLIRIKYLILEIVKLQMDYEYRVEIEKNAQTIDLFNPEIKRFSVDEGKARVIGQCIRLQQSLTNKAKSVKERASINIPFFDWKILFPNVFNGSLGSEGFDIVIGNPPYIQLQADNGKLGSMYMPHNFKTFIKSGDIFCLFYEQGYNLLKESGHLCFITSNKWMRAAYGKKTREFLSSHTNPKLLIDFAGVKIFDSATVDTNILLFEKGQNIGMTTCVSVDDKTKFTLSNISSYVNENQTINSFNNSDGWTILNSIEASIKHKLETVGRPLSEWNISINRGILTGLNEAFIVSSEKKDEIVKMCSTEAEAARTQDLFRPILRGRDVQKYKITWGGLWLLNTHNGVKGSIPAININNYPAVKTYLDSFGYRLENRDDQGDTPYNLRNCAYLKDFDKNKIIFQEIVQEGQFALDTDVHYFGNDTCRIITGDNLEFLVRILNSELFFFAIKRFYGGGALGEHGVRMKHTFFIHFPCIVPNERLTLSPTDKVDDIVYDLYGISSKEKDHIKAILHS